MGFKVQTLWQAPEINPVNGKARSIPVLNPFNKYGRVFFFSWFGFSKFHLAPVCSHCMYYQDNMADLSFHSDCLLVMVCRPSVAPNYHEKGSQT